MAKQDLIKEAQDLGIDVLPEDTIKVIQAKIDEHRDQASKFAGLKTVEPQEKQQAVDHVPGDLKRVKVTQDELMKLQDEHKLVGYDSATQEAIIKQ